MVYNRVVSSWPYKLGAHSRETRETRETWAPHTFCQCMKRWYPEGQWPQPAANRPSWQGSPDILSHLKQNLLVVLTILKDMKVSCQLGWLSHIFWKNNPNVPNHQPERSYSPHFSPHFSNNQRSLLMNLSNKIYPLVNIQTTMENHNF